MRDLLLTGATSAAMLVGMVLATRFLAQGLGSEGFGAFSMARRFWAILASLATVLGLALTRQVAVSRTESERHAYLVVGTSAAVTMAAVAILGGLLFPSRLTQLVFHDEQYSQLMLATLACFVGVCAYSVLFSFYRGSGRMGMANLWTLMVVALGPLVVAWRLAPSGRPELIMAANAGLLVVAAGPVAWKIGRAFNAGQVERVKECARQLGRYGLPRIPIGVGFATMLAIGPFMATRMGSLDGAGYLVAAQALVAIAQAGVDAFGFVTLPKVARHTMEGNVELLRARILDIQAFTLHLGLFLTVQLALWTDVLVVGWLGEGYRAAVPLAQITIVGTLPYLIYSVTRPVIDGVEMRPVIAYNVGISAVVTLIAAIGMTTAGMGLPGLAAATTLGYWSLGLLSLRFLWRRFGFPRGQLMAVRVLLLNLAIFGAGLLVKDYLAGVLAPRALFVGGGVLGGLSGLLYLGALRWMGVQWMREVEVRLLGPRAAAGGEPGR
jgi:O-antigen/teichoic acid export membrane protein